MSTRRKKPSGDPRKRALAKLRTEARRANRRAQADPTHENLTKAFALDAALRVVEVES